MGGWIWYPWGRMDISSVDEHYKKGEQSLMEFTTSDHFVEEYL